MQSIDEFKPSTTEPVFGSGLLQAKVAQQVNNEAKESEQAHPPSEPAVNGQADAALMKTPAIESNQENTSVHDSSAVHLNGKSEQPTSEAKPAADNEVPTSVSKSPNKPVQDQPPTQVTEAVAPPAAERVSTPAVKEDTASTSHVETMIADQPAEVAAAATEPDTPGPKSKVGLK